MTLWFSPHYSIDQDMLFMSTSSTKLFGLVDTTPKFSLAYHLQIEGQTNVVNRNLKTYLTCYVLGNLDNDLNG